jgi:hypothetical protein
MTVQNHRNRQQTPGHPRFSNARLPHAVPRTSDRSG